MSSTQSWTIAGSDGQPTLGNAHIPDGQPRGAIVFAHGFKGYKDYGMFPRIATHCARAGFLAHRFNFSHSGMTNNTSTFEKPDLFQRDTWNRQVEDLRAVIEAMRRGEIPGKGLQYVLFGHSRGGVSVLLTAGRYADDESFPQPAGIITAAAPDRCNTLSDDEQRTLLEQGSLESPSSRTGQVLHVGKAYLQEQLDDPKGHDLLALVARIRCPLLVIHGEDDPTVDAACAERIAQAAGGEAHCEIIPTGDHVFNTPNPMPPDEVPSPQLEQLLSFTIDHLFACCQRSRAAR